jgi:hypothetical protein
MGLFPPVLPPWSSVAVGALAVMWMVAKLLRWLPVELRVAVINWRDLMNELRRSQHKDP